MYDVVIRGGRLVTHDDTFVADVGIDGERIAAIGSALTGAVVIPADGLYVLPGAIDGHVHFRDPTYDAGEQTADTFEVGTRAAAHGGVTAVTDFAQPAPGESLLDEFERRLADAAPSVIDYGLHLNLRDADPARLEELPAIFDRGVPSIKLYMAWEGYRLADVPLFRAMESVADHNGLAVVHAEHHEIIGEMERRRGAKECRRPRSHTSAFPSMMEGEAVHRAIALASLAKARLLVFHVSCSEGVSEIDRAKRAGQKVTGEALAVHLALTDSIYAREDIYAYAATGHPPIREERHQEALWSGLAAGTLDIISTDHGPQFRRMPLSSVPPGLGGTVESRLSVVHHLGVNMGRLTLNQWVAACCTRPAEVLGMSRKGKLLPGFDADIVLFDPARETALSAATLHSAVDYDLFDGLALRGCPVMTMSRGDVIVEHGQSSAPSGRGRFLERGF